MNKDVFDKLDECRKAKKEYSFFTVNDLKELIIAIESGIITKLNIHSSTLNSKAAGELNNKLKYKIENKRIKTVSISSIAMGQLLIIIINYCEDTNDICRFSCDYNCIRDEILNSVYEKSMKFMQKSDLDLLRKTLNENRYKFKFNIVKCNSYSFLNSFSENVGKFIKREYNKGE